MDLVQDLERLRDAQMEALGESAKAELLYERIKSQIQELISQSKTFTPAGELYVYTLTADQGLLPDTDADVETNERNFARIIYIKNNKNYLEWYLTRKFAVPGYTFHISVDVSTQNSLINKKTKTTLNIVLRRPN